jgi:hypothetical protein
MNAPDCVGLGMMKPKITMRRRSVDSHLGMRLDCPPHAPGARPCAGVVTEGIQLARGGCDVRMTSCGRLSHRTRCCTTQVAGAGRIVHTAGGHPQDRPVWPWADTITTARPALCAPGAGPSPRPEDQRTGALQKPR